MHDALRITHYALRFTHYKEERRLPNAATAFSMKDKLIYSRPSDFLMASTFSAAAFMQRS